MKPWEQYQGAEGPWTAYASAEPPKEPEGPKLRTALDIARDIPAGLLRGAGSIGATLMWPKDKLDDLAQQYLAGSGQTLSGLITGKAPVSRNEQRRQDMNAGLAELGADPNSTAFGVSKVLGEVAGTLGIGGLLGSAAGAAGAGPATVNALRTSGMVTGANPAGLGARAADMGLRTAAGAGVGMASAAAVNPGDTQGIAVGGLLGGALPGAVKGVGLLGSALTSKAVGPAGERAKLAQDAINAGIPLTAADVTANPALKATRSVLDDVPLIGKAGAQSREAIQDGFNRAVGQTFGANATKLTPQVMASAKKAIGGELDRIWGGNALQIDGQLMADLTAIRNKAATKLNTEQAAQVERQIQELLQKSNGLAVDGGFANNWQSELRKLAEGEKGLHQSILGDLRASVLSAFNRGLPAADAQALSKAMGQYKAYQTVAPIVRKAEVGIGGRDVGNVPPELLPSAVMQSYGERVSQTPLGNLAQIGSQFVADRVMRTGGSARAMVQNSALGTALSLGAWQNPLVPMLALPAAYGVEKALTSPALGRALTGAAGPELDPLLLQLYRAAPVLAADR